MSDDDPIGEQPSQNGVGYGKPPEEHQFKPGQSGNPKGRPKGAKSFNTLLNVELNRSLIVAQDGKKLRMKRKAALAKGLVNNALQGKDRPREKVLDYIERDEAANAPATERDGHVDSEAIIRRYLQRKGYIDD